MYLRVLAALYNKTYMKSNVGSPKVKGLNFTCFEYVDQYNQSAVNNFCVYLVLTTDISHQICVPNTIQHSNERTLVKHIHHHIQAITRNSFVRR